MSGTSRRDFLRAAAAGAALAPALPAVAAAVDPIRRPGDKPDLKLSLAAYSFRQFLDLKKPSMTLFDFIDMAADWPLDAVELTSYYFAETNDDYLIRLREHAAKRKLAISGVPVGNTFTVRDDDRRKQEIGKVKQWTGRAHKLGAETVRVFAGNLEKGDTLESARRRVRTALESCCKDAPAGVILALENHGGITATAEDVLALVKPVICSNLGVNLDTGNFRTPDPYEDMAQLVPYAVVCQIKTEVTPAGKGKQEADLGRIVKILKDGNFHGYVALEYEAAEDPKVAVPRYLKELRKLIG
jgi:sugar phosphate isomerase/epimerase